MITLGLALIAIVAAQVTASIIEGFAIRSTPAEPTGVATDLLHRLGFPFGNLGAPTLLFLVVGLALICLPGLVGQDTSPIQDRLIGVALIVVLVLATVLAVGSLLAVRNSLHEYTARAQDPPPYVRIGFASFLLGALGSAAIAMFGSLAALSLRRRRR